MIYGTILKDRPDFSVATPTQDTDIILGNRD